MGTFNGNTPGGGRFAAPSGKNTKQSRKAGAGVQVLLSLLFFADLFLLYTIVMQMTHQQKAMEMSATANLVALIVFALGAVLLGWLVVRKCKWQRTLCIFLVIKAINRMKRKEEPAPAAPTTKDCPYCFSPVPLKATRCPHCTSELK